MDVRCFMTDSDYDKLSWAARVRLARLALPRATKRALADELGTTVHTIVNWEYGRCIPKQKCHRERLKELCENGISSHSSKISVDFLLGGIDANESIIVQPLHTRDKSSTTLVLLALATRLSAHITAAITKSMLVTSVDTVFNTYPSYANLYVTPIEVPGLRFTLRLSHLPAGTSYTLELLVHFHEEILSRYVCDITDRSAARVIALLKKFINKLKPNDKSRSRVK